MPIDPGTGIIAHAIQLAIAPVFLLTGIAGLLGVMATRLARVIDRARSFEATWSGLDANARAAARLEIRNLERRRRVGSWSINYCTVAALLVSSYRHSVHRGVFRHQPKVARRRVVRGRDAGGDLRPHLLPARGLSRHTHN
jgi:hypothetical protein